uniref:Uncharacterized protein LOC108950678 n=1 Tax=Phallusia mammillata TaxID=59560 RepID=A0A6F9DJE0_9ASCI|nr:uncharacterized protein LOC108950678 [Phallusia mammillata]
MKKTAVRHLILSMPIYSNNGITGWGQCTHFPKPDIILLEREAHSSDNARRLLLETACTTSKMRLLRSLRIKNSNYYATRPLFVKVHDGHVNNDEKTYQLYDQSNVFPDLVYKETFRPNRMFTFKVHNTYYLFVNYTLARVETNIQLLSPIIKMINESFQSYDFVEAAQLLKYIPSENRALSDVLAVLSSTQLNNERMNVFFDSQTNLSTEGGIDDKVLPQNLLKSAFITLLSSVTSPAANAFLSFLVIQALFWGIALSLVSA